MHKCFIAAAVLSVLIAGTAGAATLNEAVAGEFGDRFDAPTDFTGYDKIIGASKGGEDFEYFRFDRLPDDAQSLDFTLTNLGSGSNMSIRLSSTPFTMAEWDWRITELDAGNSGGRQLYANQWSPVDSYSFVVPAGFDGPLFGFARFYGTTSPSSFTVDLVRARSSAETGDETILPESSPVPLPGALPLLLVGIGAMAGLRRLQRMAG